MIRILLLCIGLWLAAPEARAAEFYVDSVNGTAAGNGLRGLGNHCTFQYNTVKNCYDVNRNHDDGFQSWSVGPNGIGTGEVVRMVLRGNTIINYEIC